MLILVMGVLVMLLLIGMAMLTTTRHESGRINSERIRIDVDAGVERIVDHTLEILRRDLWGDDQVLFNHNRGAVVGADGRSVTDVIDEPYDGFGNLGLDDAGQADPAVPWTGDAWLASTIPYLDLNPAGRNQPGDYRLVWRRASWAPLDDRQAQDQLNRMLGELRGFVGSGWATDEPGLATDKNPFQLVDHVFLPIPGGAALPDPLPAADVDWSRRNYFSRSVVFKSLYLDADGDGIRDSVRLMGQLADPNLDVAIRIVDHGSMLNLNTSFDRIAWETYFNTAVAQGGAGLALLAGGPLPLQGHTVAELLLDPLLPAAGAGINPQDDAGLTGIGLRLPRDARLTDAGNAAWNLNPAWYAAGYLRGTFLADWNVPRYPPGDSESALRNRHGLLPFATYLEAYAASDTVGRAKYVEADFLDTLVPIQGDGDPHHFARHDEATAVGQGPGGFPHWVSRMSPTNPASPIDPLAIHTQFVRRPLLTTTSKSQQRPGIPASLINRSVALPQGMRLPMIFSAGVFAGTAFDSPSGSLERIGQDIVDPRTNEIIPAAARFDLLDINADPRGMGFGLDLDANGTPGEWTDDLVGYAAQIAGAMWLALEGDPVDNTDDVTTFQGLNLNALQHIRMAWQFAANLIDFRDTDMIPFRIDPLVTGLADPVFGVEPQPFITEVYARVVDTGGDLTVNSDYAVELYNPFAYELDLAGWQIRTDEGTYVINTLKIPAYSIRVVGSSGVAVADEDIGLVIASALNAGARPLEERFVALERPGGLVVDRLEPVAGEEEFATDTSTISLSRELQVTPPTPPAAWRFTVNKHLLVDGTHTLGSSNDPSADFSSDVASSPWMFHSDPGDPGNAQEPGLGEGLDLNRPWSFDSVAQLTNLFLLGPDSGSLLGGGRTVPEQVAAMQGRIMENAAQTAVGRPVIGTEDRVTITGLSGLIPSVIGGPNDIDKEPWTNRLFALFTVFSPTSDAIDLNGDGRIPRLEWIDFDLDGDGPNEGDGHEWVDIDGDGVVTVPVAPFEWIDNDFDGQWNEPTEAYDLNRTAAGQLNVNTAPEPVLRAIQYLHTDGAFADPTELAEAIVAYREGRTVNTGFGPVTPVHRRMKPFRTVAELMTVALAPAYSFSAYALDGADLATLPGVPGGDGLADDFRERDAILNRIANLVTVRSDVYTIYIALVDNQGTPTDPDDDQYVRRVQLTVDRTNCYRDPKNKPEVIVRDDGGYYDVTR